MRPAWLPEQATLPTALVESRCHARPRSAASRPSSPCAVSSSPPRDAMVHSARQLLHTPDPSPRSTSATSEATGFVSLRDFMDSFPLVPLAIIPRLRLVDLLECEAGLGALDRTLAADSNAEDAQLGKYIARQLGLVQRHMEQAHARERVLKLLNGEEPAMLSTIASSQIQRSTTTSTKTLPVFLQPTAAPPLAVVHNASAAVLTTTTSASSLVVKKPNAMSQLSKAKAVAKATATTAFVITTHENSLKARQKRTKKKTTQQREEEKTRQQEREKETRRQAAYQRLMARQALQTKKKQEAQDRKKKLVQHETAKGPEGSFVEVTETTTSTPEQVDGVVDNTSSSDESEVSNCSDRDEADEKAILEMPVVIPVDDYMQQQNEANDDAASTVPPDETGSEDDDDVEEETDEVDERIEESRTSETAVVGMTLDREDVEAVGEELPPETDEPETTDRVDEISGAEHDGGDDCHDNVTGAFASPHNVIEKESVESEEAQEQRVREAIELQLQQFVTQRTQSALDQLRERRADEQQQQQLQQTAAPSHAYQRPPRSSRPATSACLEPASASPRPHSVHEPEASITIESKRQPMPTERTSIPPSPTKKRPLSKPVEKPSTSSSSNASTSVLVPRVIGRDVQDYRGYFANFFCILTSVFEQRAAFTGATSSTSSSSLSTTTANMVSATVAHAGDQALRLQLKLYHGWETIMNDYATVFGSSIPTPDGLFSTSPSAAISPYTAHYRINSHTRKEVSDIVVTALEKLGDWDEHPSGLGLKTTWNLLWTWSKPNVERKTLLAWQKVNHFQHAKALTRKDCLKKNIGKYHAVGGRLKQAYDIVPSSFLLPHEYVAFVQAFQERAKLVPPGKNIWIMKPVALSRGRGISLVNDLSDVVYGEQVVIQEYIANPLLLDGFKFDLRLYVLVTSFNPLEVFFYEEGFVRMCTRRYEDSDLTNLFIHLTNSSIQKENQDAIAANPDNPINAAQHDAEAGGTKMTLAYLWKRLEAMGANVATVKNDILTVILKALMCGEDHIPFQVNSFDLYGYDILLDTNFRPWLIEINSSPSMARENDLDYQVKDALIYDTLKLVNPLHFDRAKLVEVIARRFHDADVDKKRSHANTRHPKEAEAIVARQLNEDLTDILRGHVPRAYGELPDHMGSYTRLAPHTTIHNQLMKLKKSCLRLDRK